MAAKTASALPRATSSVRARLTALRARMRKAGLAAYFVPSTDPHQSEYVPECWQRRPWLSGFTGSAGDVLVTLDTAGLWTDGRYYLQASQELRGSGVLLFKAADQGTPSPQEWLATNLNRGAAVGVDPRVISLDRRAAFERRLKDAGMTFELVDENLVDAIWPDRPSLPVQPVRTLAKQFTGETTAAKLKAVRKEIHKAGAAVHVITMLDSIAWLFNIRGQDVAYNPVSIAYAILGPDQAELFIDPRKVPDPVLKALGDAVSVRPYDEFPKALRALGKEHEAVLLDPSSCSAWVASLLKGAKLVEAPSPIVAMKARKNKTELDGMRKAHVRDGAAVVRFLRWLHDAVPKGDVTEISAADELERLRREGENFQGLSFRTISGYAENGAIIHYSVTPKTSLPLRAEGLYLIDSGGQYLDGTTDITRTVLLGASATAEQKDRFTRVLKGHIALARAVFPKGVSGVRLDTLARLPLWEAGLDYGHGTGHGVGAFLNVHEGPHSISVRGTTSLELGNILSNEPGYYQAGAYGIRIENLVVVEESELKQNGTPFFRFETITQCPIDTKLIDRALLDDAERAWLNAYHARVRDTLTPLLAPPDARWLEQATRPI